MRRYIIGYVEAREAIASNSIAQNLRLLDELDGRCGLTLAHGDHAVRDEALRQIELALPIRTIQTAGRSKFATDRMTRS